MSESAKRRKPNIVIILDDDMGFSDIGCYGGEIDTPNLDRLAQNGLRYSQFYNTARCCPSRASLLTGLHPHQTGDRHPDLRHGPRAMRAISTVGVSRLPRCSRGDTGPIWRQVARREQPQGAGRTPGRCSGGSTATTAPSSARAASTSRIRSRGGTITLEHGPSRTGFFYTDAISDQAAASSRAARRNPEAPFFLYVAYTAPHWPLHAHQEDIAKYKRPLQRRLGPVARERLTGR